MIDNRINLITDNAITEIGKKAYDDMGHPVLHEVGASAQGILKFVSLPFKFLGLTAEQLENKYKNFIEKSINKVPVEKRSSPASYIISPLMDGVKYHFDEGAIYEMYSELLSSAIDFDKCKQVHPLHLNLLRQLSPLDADIFNDCFRNDDSCCLITTYDSTLLSERAKENYKMFLISFKNTKFENITEYKYDWGTIRRSFDVMEAINLIEQGSFYHDDYLQQIIDNFQDNICEYIPQGYKHIAYETISCSLSFAGQLFRDMCVKSRD